MSCVITTTNIVQSQWIHHLQTGERTLESCRHQTVCQKKPSSKTICTGFPLLILASLLLLLLALAEDDPEDLTAPDKQELLSGRTGPPPHPTMCRVVAEGRCIGFFDLNDIGALVDPWMGFWGKQLAIFLRIGLFPPSEPSLDLLVLLPPGTGRTS